MTNRNSNSQSDVLAPIACMRRMLAPLVVMALRHRRKFFRGELLVHKSQLKRMPEQCADRDRMSKVIIMCVQKGFVNMRLYVERPILHMASLLMPVVGADITMSLPPLPQAQLGNPVSHPKLRGWFYKRVRKHVAWKKDGRRREVELGRAVAMPWSRTSWLELKPRQSKWWSNGASQIDPCWTKWRLPLRHVGRYAVRVFCKVMPNRMWLEVAHGPYQHSSAASAASQKNLNLSMLDQRNWKGKGKLILCKRVMWTIGLAIARAVVIWRPFQMYYLGCCVNVRICVYSRCK